MNKALIVSIFICLSCLTTTSISRADWVSNWVNNTVASYTGPSHFESGKRGYVTFGSLSVRNAMINDQLVAFQLPSIRVGCGGIDLFGGGFHFMDFDYLVQQFQNIISAAPAFAFEYALRSISEQSGTIIDSLKSIADVLNQTQYNSCAMSRQLGYWMARKGDGAYRAIGQNLKSAVPEMKWLNDSDSMYYKVLKDIHDVMNGRISAPEAKSLDQNCPGDFLAVLQKGSIVKYIHDTYFPGTDTDSLEYLIRGYIGDVLFERKGGLWKAHYQPPCGGVNDKDSFKAFVEGTVQGMTLNSAVWNPDIDLPPVGCSPLYSGGNDTILNLASTALKHAYTSLQTNSALSTSDVRWLKIMPLPILRYLKQLYIYQAPDSAVETISGPAGYALGFEMLSIIYGEVARGLKFILDKRVNACGTKVAADEMCYLCQQDETIVSSLKELQETLQAEQNKAWEKWRQVQSDLAKTQKLLTVLETTSQEAIRGKLATGREDY